MAFEGYVGTMGIDIHVYMHRYIYIYISLSLSLSLFLLKGYEKVTERPYMVLP